MIDIIRAQLEQTLRDWQDRETIRTIAIGHTVQASKDEHGRAIEERIRFQQNKAHAYVFDILRACLDRVSAAGFLMHEHFVEIADELAPTDLTANERAAGQSLAWKALTVGYKRAIDGFPESQYIELTREADA